MHRLPAILLKLLPVALAIAWVVRAKALPSARYRRLVLAGLCCGAAGDALLALPAGFVAGLLAFLLGHLFYAAAFIDDGARPRIGSLAFPLILGGALVATLWPALGALQIPVLLYLLAIGAMAGLAIDRWRRSRAVLLSPALKGAARAALGACCFLISDAALAWARFSGPLGPRWLSGLLILGTYYLAQALLASSVGGSRAKP